MNAVEGASQNFWEPLYQE